MQRGQAMVEMALTITILAFVLVLAIQFALLGNAALALNQATYQAARYAAVNWSASQSTVHTYVLGMASPILTGNSGANLSITLTPTATPRTAFSSVTVSATFDATSLIVVPNPFFGVTFPTSLTATESAMVE